MKCSVLFEAEEIFYLPIVQKREYMDMASDVKDSHSRKYIYQMEKCNYVVSQNGNVARLLFVQCVCIMRFRFKQIP